MRSKEALETIGELDLFEECSQSPYEPPLKKQYEKEYNILKELVERDTPKKPEIGINQKGKMDLICPSCNLDVVLRENFCSHCGKRLDWSEL